MSGLRCELLDGFDAGRVRPYADAAYGGFRVGADGDDPDRIARRRASTAGRRQVNAIGRLVRLLPAALLLASCQPPQVLVRAAFLDGALAFVSAKEGDGGNFCWREAAVVDDTLRPAWRFTASGLGECRGLLPLFYGRPPAGARSPAPARPLEPGRLYLFVGDATAQVSGAFALSRAGNGLVVHNVDPDSPAAAALRRRWWASRSGGAGG